MDLSRLQGELVRLLAEIEAFADNAHTLLVLAACEPRERPIAHASIPAGFRDLVIKHANLWTWAREHGINAAGLRYDHLQEYCLLCLNNAIARRLDEVAILYVRAARRLDTPSPTKGGTP